MAGEPRPPDALRADLLAALQRCAACQAQQLLDEGARCQEEVTALVAQFSAQLRAEQEAQAAQPCAGCLAKEEEARALRSQLETALGYRKTCKAQKEQIAGLSGRLAALDTKARFQRAQLLHRGAAAEPSLAARQLAAAEVEAETRGHRIQELEAQNRELLKHKEVVKAAYKQERQAHASLQASLAASGWQPAVLQERNVRAQPPGAGQAQARQPASGCLPSSQPAEPATGATPCSPPASGATPGSVCPAAGSGPGAGTPQSCRRPTQAPAGAQRVRLPWEPPAGEAAEAPGSSGRAGALSAQELAAECAAAEAAAQPAAGPSGAAQREPARSLRGGRGEQPGVDRVKRKSEELGPSPVRPAVGRAVDGTQRKARKSKLAGAGERQPVAAPTAAATPVTAAAVASPTSRLAPVTQPAEAAQPPVPLAPSDAPARVRGERPGAGVLETLHILDLQQGARPGMPRRGQRPAIVDTVPVTAANGWRPAGPADAEAPAAAQPKPQPRRPQERAPRPAAGANVAAAEAARARVQQRAEAARAKWGGDEPGYKYRDVVRKKAERERLQGFTCPDCEGFYRALQSWGQDVDMPACGHGGGSGKATPIKQMIQDASRHRFKYRPPSTPPGYWDMGFGSDKEEEAAAQVAA